MLIANVGGTGLFAWVVYDQLSKDQASRETQATAAAEKREETNEKRRAAERRFGERQILMYEGLKTLNRTQGRQALVLNDLVRVLHPGGGDVSHPNELPPMDIEHGPHA